MYLSGSFSTSVEAFLPGVFDLAISFYDIFDFQEEAAVVVTAEITIQVVTIWILQPGGRESPHASQNKRIFPNGIMSVTGLDVTPVAETTVVGPIDVIIVESA